MSGYEGTILANIEELGIDYLIPIDVVVGTKKVVDVDRYYSPERLRPKYETLVQQPLFIMTSDT